MMVLGSPLGRLHFIGWIIITILNTIMVLIDEKKTRITLLMFVVVLQHITLLLFIIDYERYGRTQWKKREETLRKELIGKCSQCAQKDDELILS